jgi:hypothetical protein
MACYAYLETPLRCPACGARVSNVLWFQWGYCAGYSGFPESTYRLGAAIRWQHRPDGSTPVWTYFARPRRGGNLGDPAETDVVVRDVAQFEHSSFQVCTRCNQAIGGAALEVRSGVIRRAWVFRPGELDTGSEVFVVRPDGSLEARPKWKNHPMSYEE